MEDSDLKLVLARGKGAEKWRRAFVEQKDDIRRTADEHETVAFLSIERHLADDMLRLALAVILHSGPLTAEQARNLRLHVSGIILPDRK